MPEDTTAATEKAPKKSVKKAAAKKTKAVTASATPKTPRKKTKAKRQAYQIGTGAISAPYADTKLMLEDLSLTAKPDDTVTIWRESRSGKLKTKVRIG